MNELYFLELGIEVFTNFPSLQLFLLFMDPFTYLDVNARRSRKYLRLSIFENLISPYVWQKI